MLLLMRKRIGSVVIKAFAFLLILGFGTWGIQDMLGYQFGGGGAIAEVGEMRLEPNGFYREVNQEIARMRPLFGGKLDMEQARKLGLVDMVLNRQLDAMATMVTANKLGIAISDKLVRTEIKAEPMFKGLAGNFDKDRFRQLLNNNGLSETTYVQKIQTKLASQQILGSMSAGASAPKNWVNTIYRAREEKRNTDTVFIADKGFSDIVEPTETQLRSHFDANKHNYMAPEYRSLSYVHLNVNELAKEVSIAQEALREAFDQRADEFITQEKRKVRQMIIADESKAKSAYKRITEGTDFLVVAKEVAGLNPSAIDLGYITKGDLMPELSGSVFEATKGNVTAPVKSTLGWHIFEIRDVRQGGSLSFEEVRPKLQKEMAREKAIDGLYELSNKFEDALGGGGSLEDAANQINLKVHNISSIDKEGRDRAGLAAEGLSGSQVFLTVAFSTEEQAESGMTESKDSGFFILRVDKINRPALRPFEEVRDKVADAWLAEQGRTRAERRAKMLLDAINAGKSLVEIARTELLTVKSFNALFRDGRGGGIEFDTALISEVFKLKVGKAVMGRVADGYRVAVLKSIETPDPAADKDGVNELAKTLSRSLQSDIVGQLKVAFRKSADVKVYPQALDALFGAQNK